ncbi:TetR family transcriptional regulator [Streptomyces sp. NPDC006552]|uniref:TetR/AcrR family transcriptional regulator n=1 Tax=Streptomyces sp. NPDC006552 TaxID=3157179 RepID=UPI0033A22E0D
MRQNSARRTALLDAAIEVLAREGSRGLTLRAVDAQAGLPIGTCSNYFRNRDELLLQIAGRTHERITPDPDQVTQTMRAKPDRDLVTLLMRQLQGRMEADRAGYLAMLELRLEATRRPGLGRELNKVLSQVLEDNVRFHLDAGLPGDRIDVVVLYLVMHGMILDDLTVPEVLAPYAGADLVGEFTRRLLADDTVRAG